MLRAHNKASIINIILFARQKHGFNYSNHWTQMHLSENRCYETHYGDDINIDVGIYVLSFWTAALPTLLVICIVR